MGFFTTGGFIKFGLPFGLGSNSGLFNLGLPFGFGSSFISGSGLFNLGRPLTFFFLVVFVEPHLMMN